MSDSDPIIHTVSDADPVHTLSILFDGGAKITGQLPLEVCHSLIEQWRTNPAGTASINIGEATWAWAGSKVVYMEVSGLPALTEARTA